MYKKNCLKLEQKQQKVLNVNVGALHLLQYKIISSVMLSVVCYDKPQTLVSPLHSFGGFYVIIRVNLFFRYSVCLLISKLQVYQYIYIFLKARDTRIITGVSLNTLYVIIS